MFGLGKPKTPPAPAAKKGRGYFSTHETDDDMPTSNPGMVLDKIVSQIKPPVVTADGSTMDADDVEDMGRSAKAAYQFQRGESISDALILWYARQGFIGHQLCAILSQHWLIYKACSMPARDAIRNGFDIVSGDGDVLAPEVITRLRKMDKRMNLAHNCEQFVTFGRVFGIRIALFEVSSEDPDYYKKPFNPDGVTVGSYKGIVQVDPYWCAPMLDQAAASEANSRHFYEPTWWQINGKQYHRTHLIIFRNGELPDVLKPSYIYGGVPVPQRIMERVYASERTANEGPLLAMTKRLTVLYLDASAVMGNLVEFARKMADWTGLRDNHGVKIADKENETIDQHDTGLADLDSVIMTQYQLVASASNVPATKLLGTTPKGFNATGEYEESSYHEELESIQVNDLNRLIARHHLLCVRSSFAKELAAKIGDVAVSWLPLDSPTAVEWADINLKKAQTAAALIDAGVLDMYDVRDNLRGDPNSGFSGIEEAERPEVL